MSDLRSHSLARSAEQRAEQTRLQAARLNLRASEMAQYSLANAIACLQTERVRSGSFEAEVSAALEKHQQTSTPNSILVPWWAFQRDLAVGNSGGYLVETSTEVDSMADALRGLSVVATLPISVIPNAVGNFTIPVESAAPTAYALPTETSEITPSTPTIGSVAMTPKSVGAYTQLSAQFLKQTGTGGNAYATRTLAKSVAALVDNLAMNGSGGAGEPLGLVSQISGSVSGTSITEAGIREFQTDIGANLGPDCGWVTTGTIASLLAGRQQFTGSSTTLWSGNLYSGAVGGWPAYSSPSVPASHLIFGAWSSFVLANWGPALEIAANPYADFKAGIVGLRVITSFDVGLVRPGAFSVATAVT